MNISSETHRCSVLKKIGFEANVVGSSNLKKVRDYTESEK